MAAIFRACIFCNLEIMLMELEGLTDLMVILN